MTLGTMQGLVAVPRLTVEQRTEIELLAVLCREHDGLELSLYLEPDTAALGEETYQFLYYDKGTLVGFVSTPSGDPVEVIGMVDPAYRRRGIGKCLLGAAQNECRLRRAENFLLVCEESSASGIDFTRTIGAQYEFTEYLMQLDTAALPPAFDASDSILLKWVGPEETEALTDLLIAASSLSQDEVPERLRKWLYEQDNRFYLGIREGKPIGMIRVNGTSPHLYLYTFCVLPEYRGRGYGRQILTGVVRDLLPKKRDIRLEVETNNRNALSLYHSCGFRGVTAYRYYKVGS